MTVWSGAALASAETSGGAVIDGEHTVLPSHCRDCHFDDTPCLSILKHLLKIQGGAAE